MSISRRFAVLLTGIILLCGGWTIAWSVLAEQFANGLSRTLFQDRKGQIQCQDRTSGGFPFRLSESCSNATITPATATAAAATESHAASKAQLSWSEAVLAELSLTTLPYQPRRAIAEAQGPLMLFPHPRNAAQSSHEGPFAEETGPPQARLDWERARASFRHDFEELTRVDGEIVAAHLRLEWARRGAHPGMIQGMGQGMGQAIIEPFGAWSLARGEFHMRKTPSDPAGTDLSLRLKGLRPDSAADSDALDLLLTLSATPATSLHRGDVSALVDEWQRSDAVTLNLAQLTLALGQSRFAARGHLSIDQRGLLSGELHVEVNQPGELMAKLSAHYGGVGLSGGSFAESGLALGLLGAATGEQSSDGSAPALSFALRLDQGAIKLGFLTLGTLPSLYDLAVLDKGPGT